MNFLKIFNWFSQNINATVEPSVSSLDNNKTSYTKNNTEVTKQSEICIANRKVKFKKPRAKVRNKPHNKPHKVVTFAKSHLSKEKEYNIVMLTWENNKPVVKCYDNITDITSYKLKDQAGYIFKNYSGVVKVAEDSYLNTTTGKIYTQTTIDTQKIEWLGSYLQKYANNQMSKIEGEITTINNLPLINKTAKNFFDNSDSGSEGLSADYAGSTSEDEAFLTGNSEFETK
jgi:hypothetical protein